MHQTSWKGKYGELETANIHFVQQVAQVPCETRFSNPADYSLYSGPSPLFYMNIFQASWVNGLPADYWCSNSCEPSSRLSSLS